MSGRTRPTEYPKFAEQPAEKKKGFADFINKIKPVNEEKDHWVNMLRFCFLSNFSTIISRLLLLLYSTQVFSKSVELRNI